MELAQRQCVPCRVLPVKGEALEMLFQELQDGWKMINEYYLQKDYVFPTYQEALRFTNLIANLAESEGHHPELILSFRNVRRVSYWTHKIDGLVESDFIMAAKSDLIHTNEFPAT